MKIQTLVCPHCGGEVDIKISTDMQLAFCQYCGKKVLLENEKDEITLNYNENINKNISINKIIHKRTTDDAEVIRATAEADIENKRLKNEASEWKRGLIAVLIIFGLLFSVVFGVVFWINNQKDNARNEGKITAGLYDDLIGEDYKTVEAHFKAAGFTDVELVELDAGLAVWNKGEVKSISVGGNTSFDSYDYFDPNTKVVISYYKN